MIANILQIVTTIAHVIVNNSNQFVTVSVNPLAYRAYEDINRKPHLNTEVNPLNTKRKRRRIESMKYQLVNSISCSLMIIRHFVTCFISLTSYHNSSGITSAVSISRSSTVIKPLFSSISISAMK